MAKVASAILSIYIAGFVYTNAFFVKTLTVSGAKGSTLFWNHLGIFAALAILAFILISKYVSVFGGNLKLFLSVLAFLGLLIAILTHLIPINAVYKLPPFLSTYFASATAYCAWLIAPLVVLFF